ncbi:phosphotransferase [Halorussus sp. MSC15.2]|uniref:phosphotransferase n=1 Tax=Halorussus sp. MSC15.2 TaxID=2283638 RepID=UPI0013D426C5|nr:phosphotransferase [Halorussus sp. MSC15.2]NEU56759.1 phosphotransferase [Halorussus sp. MSC15.2]
MVADVGDALATYTDDYEIRRELPSRGPNGVYEVIVDGQTAVCKVARENNAHIGQRVFVAQYVGEQTTVPTPALLAAEDDYALFEWINGTPYRSNEVRDLRERRLRNAGAMLARLHTEADFASHGYLCAQDGQLDLDAKGTWSEMLETLVSRWCDDLAGTQFEEAGQSVRKFVRTHQDALNNADGPDLIHGDYQPANVLFDGERVVGVLDWEFSLVGSGEFDLCRAEREFFDWYDAPEEDDELRDALQEGYESVRPLPSGFTARREVYRGILKLDPMRFFNTWKDEVKEPAATADSMVAFVRSSLANARDALNE